MKLSEKFVNKYMRLAKQITLDNDSCYSRQIGVVIVDPAKNQIKSTGYNGPPSGTPHCDSLEFLEEFFWPQLTDAQKWAINKTPAELAGCKVCPRRLVGAKTGELLNLCSCAHAERNAIERCGLDLTGCSILCYCYVPCLECTKAIIESGIREVYYLQNEVYNGYGGHKEGAGVSGDWKPDASSWLMLKKGITMIPVSEVDNNFFI